MRPQAAREDRVAVHEQVVRGDRRGDVLGRARDEERRLARGDMLEHQAQLREAAHERHEDRLDERLLAVEDVDLRIRHFAVHQERDAVRGHRLEHRVAAADVRHARIGIRRGARGVVLHRLHEARRLRLRDLVGRGVVGEVERHQRLEGRAGRKGGEDALAIAARVFHGEHRRPQVRHHDRARELARGVGHHRLHRLAVAEVDVPVVGARERELVRHALDYSREGGFVIANAH